MQCNAMLENASTGVEDTHCPFVCCQCCFSNFWWNLIPNGTQQLRTRGSHRYDIQILRTDTFYSISYILCQMLSKTYIWYALIYSMACTDTGCLALCRATHSNDAESDAPIRIPPLFPRPQTLDCCWSLSHSHWTSVLYNTCIVCYTHSLTRSHCV